MPHMASSHIERQLIVLSTAVRGLLQTAKSLEPQKKFEGNKQTALEPDKTGKEDSRAHYPESYTSLEFKCKQMKAKKGQDISYLAICIHRTCCNLLTPNFIDKMLAMPIYNMSNVQVIGCKLSPTISTWKSLGMSWFPS